jgi:hypothetical protein
VVAGVFNGGLLVTAFSLLLSELPLQRRSLLVAVNINQSTELPAGQRLVFPSRANALERVSAAH